MYVSSSCHIMYSNIMSYGIRSVLWEALARTIALRQPWTCLPYRWLLSSLLLMLRYARVLHPAQQRSIKHITEPRQPMHRRPTVWLLVLSCCVIQCTHIYCFCLNRFGLFFVFPLLSAFRSQTIAATWNYWMIHSWSIRDVGR